MAMAILALRKTSRFGGLDVGELKTNPTEKQKRDAIKHSDQAIFIDDKTYSVIYEAAKKAAIAELTTEKTTENKEVE